jgi:membrane-associated phospholipid phosphatase
MAATIAAWRAWPALGRVMLIPFLLLVVAVVYCQMHYAVDAVSGLVVGLGVSVAAPRLWIRSVSSRVARHEAAARPPAA